MQRRRFEALLEQPVAHRELVERPQIGRGTGEFHGQRERPPPTIAALLEAFHQRVKALVLRALSHTHAMLRHDAVLPPAVAIEALLRRRAKVALIVTRSFGVRVAVQNAQFGEQLTYRRRFARR